MKTPPLPAAAKTAWAAYYAMDQSKRDHFSYLQKLELKSKQGHTRSLAEQSHLEFLLGAHNECVSAFGLAVQALRTEDGAAYEQFLQHLTRLNKNLGEEDP